MTAICLPIDASSGAPSFPAAQHRVAMGALMCGRTDRALGAVSGVRPGSEPTVSATSTTWTVTPFAAVADPGTGNAVGAFLVAFTANVTGGVNAADATNTRLDRLDVQVPDDPAGASPLAPVITYNAGVPGGGLPAAPVRSFPLATITVPPVGGGSPSIVLAAPRAVASGGLMPVSGASDYPASPYIGQAIYDESADVILVRRTAGAWDQYTPTILRTFSGNGAALNMTGANTELLVPGSAWVVQANIGDLSYASGVVTINTPGYYRWAATIDYPAGTAGNDAQTYIKLNGAGQLPGRDSLPIVGAHRTTVTAGGILPVKCNAGDTLQVAVNCLDSALANITPYAFAVERVG